MKHVLDKCYSTKTHEEVEGPEKKSVIMCLPYLGINSLRMERQLKRIISAVCPWISLRVIFKPVHKLSVLSKLKSEYPLLSKSGVVYKVSCGDCNQFYIGMTGRRLGQRMAEHQDSSESALNKHVVETGHHVDFGNPCVLACDSVTERLYIKEAIKIQELMAYKSLNRNVGSVDMKLW